MGHAKSRIKPQASHMQGLSFTPMAPRYLSTFVVAAIAVTVPRKPPIRINDRSQSPKRKECTLPLSHIPGPNYVDAYVDVDVYVIYVDKMSRFLFSELYDNWISH